MKIYTKQTHCRNFLDWNETALFSIKYFFFLLKFMCCFFRKFINIYNAAIVIWWYSFRQHENYLRSLGTNQNECTYIWRTRFDVSCLNRWFVIESISTDFPAFRHFSQHTDIKVNKNIFQWKWYAFNRQIWLVDIKRIGIVSDNEKYK